MLRAAALTFVVAGSTTQASGAERDPETGLVVAPGFETVKATCTACHSAKLVTQMRGDRALWASLIRWMQETQNLWFLPPVTETEILDYLSTHYAPARVEVRRAPLAPGLLPPRVQGERSVAKPR